MAVQGRDGLSVRGGGIRPQELLPRPPSVDAPGTHGILEFYRGRQRRPGMGNTWAPQVLGGPSSLMRQVPGSHHLPSKPHSSLRRRLPPPQVRVTVQGPGSGQKAVRERGRGGGRGGADPKARARLVCVGAGGRGGSGVNCARAASLSPSRRTKAPGFGVGSGSAAGPPSNLCWGPRPQQPKRTASLHTPAGGSAVSASGSRRPGLPVPGEQPQGAAPSPLGPPRPSPSTRNALLGQPAAGRPTGLGGA